MFFSDFGHMRTTKRSVQRPTCDHATMQARLLAFTAWSVYAIADGILDIVLASLIQPCDLCTRLFPIEAGCCREMLRERALHCQLGYGMELKLFRAKSCTTIVRPHLVWSHPVTPYQPCIQNHNVKMLSRLAVSYHEPMQGDRLNKLPQAGLQQD